MNHSEISVGVYFIRRVKGSEDSYADCRSFGPMVLMATASAIALVTVSLATCRKHPAPFLNAAEDGLPR